MVLWSVKVLFFSDELVTAQIVRVNRPELCIDPYRPATKASATSCPHERAASSVSACMTTALEDSSSQPCASLDARWSRHDPARSLVQRRAPALDSRLPAPLVGARRSRLLQLLSGRLERGINGARLRVLQPLVTCVLPLGLGLRDVGGDRTRVVEQLAS